MVRYMKIMVVEDEATSALIMTVFFNSIGYDIGNIAATGEEAFTRSLNEKPDLICMDIQLAGKIDGIEAAETILKHNQNTYILFITAYSDDQTIARAKKLNPIAYLLKPFDMNELKKIIESIKHKQQ